MSIRERKSYETSGAVCIVTLIWRLPIVAWQLVIAITLTTVGVLNAPPNPVILLTKQFASTIDNCLSGLLQDATHLEPPLATDLFLANFA